MRFNDITKSRVRVRPIITESRSVGQILLELNVINADTIDTYLTDIVARAPAKTQTWFLTRAKKYLINSEEDNARVTQFSSPAEPWMKQRHEEGVALYRFNPTGNLSNKLNHVADWLNAINNIVTGEATADQQTTLIAKKTLKGLGNMSITQAISMSDVWTAKLAKDTTTDDISTTEEAKEGLEFVVSVGDYAWYKLTTSLCLSREGNRMGHCVGRGGYASDVQQGATQLYSLRDKNNRPRATVEVRHDELNQIKGKGNKPPVSKYIQPTLDMLNYLKLPANHIGSSDIQRMGVFYNPSNTSTPYTILTELGELLIGNDNNMLRRISADIINDKYDTNDKIYHIVNGQAVDTISIVLKDGRDQWLISSPSIKLVSLIIAYVNGEQPAKRPWVSSDDLYQNPDTFAIGRTPAETSKSITKAGPFSAHKMLESSRYTSLQSYIGIFNTSNNKTKLVGKIINQPEGKLFTSPYQDVRSIIVTNLKHYVTILNTLKVGEIINLHEIRDLESYKIFFDTGKKKFTTDVRVAGKQFKHDDKLHALKTASSIKIYTGDVELADIALRHIIRYHAETVYIDWLVIKDRLAFLNNLPAVANTLNHYNIKRESNHAVNKILTASGLKYANDTSWSSLKLKPKSFNKGQGFEVFSFRKEFLIQDENNRMIAKTKSDYKNHIATIHVVKSGDTDKRDLTIIRALQSLSKKDVEISNSALKLGLSTSLWQEGLIVDDNSIKPMSDVHATKTMAQTGSGRWIKEPFSSADKLINITLDAKSIPIRPKDTLYTFYNRKTPQIRVRATKPYSADPEVQDIFFIDSDETITTATHSNVQHHAEALSVLLKKSGVRIGILSGLGFYYQKGKLLDINQNPKLKGYLDGIIAYEDGHVWKVNKYNSKKWELSMPDKDGRKTTILMVHISDGIDQIEFKNDKVRKNTKLYRSFLNDMMDISDDLFSGED